MKVVIDTNIVFSAILNSQSWIGQILLHPGKSLRFYSPQFLQFEIQNNLDKIRKITKIDDSELEEMINAFYSKIHFIADELIPKRDLKKADDMTRDVDFDDIMFVALSMHLRCRLWTGDKVLISALKKRGFNRFITTRELTEKLQR